MEDYYPCTEGDLVAVKLLTNKAHYNSLELITGRMSTLKVGDVIVGALGHRNALQGYAGHIPQTLCTGDKINILNLGGVLGHCDSYSPIVGPPHECEVIGSVLEFPELHSRKGRTANISNGSQKLQSRLGGSLPPIIAVVGTSMNSGKTEACLAVIQQLVHQNLRVSAAKTTGVSLRRDILAMEDAGAQEALIFTDFGVVTTQDSNAPNLTKTMINCLATSQPDVIVLELGDGLIGEYGVSAILNDPEIAQSLTCVVLAATDPVGAMGGVSILSHRHGLRPTLITGPATDNLAGIRIIERETSIPSLNARHSAEQIAALLKMNMEKCLV